jgi:16S rRNA (uracil1498-N3)-methyltransferase
MHRFFVDKKNILEDQKSIVIHDMEDVKHINKVLRLIEGEKLEICDGNNKEYITEIIAIEKSKIYLEILETREGKTEPNIEVTLFQAIPKSTKMDIIIQKCTEVGIKSIIPIFTERTVVQLKDKKSQEKKVERWQKIANEAAKQCKRGMIPQIGLPITFHDMLQAVTQYDLSVIPYEKEACRGLKKLFAGRKNIKKVAIMIGPEGGFEESEIAQAKEADMIPITLGPRILRTETAGLVTLSIFMYEIGDLGGI